MISEKAAALAEAVPRKAHEIVEGVLMHLRLRLRSLKLPQSAFDEKLAAFDKALNQILRDRVITQDLPAGDKRRAMEYLEEQAGHLRRQARAALGKALRDSPAVEENGRVHEVMAQEVLAEAIPAFFEKQLGGMASQMNECLAQILEPYHTRLNELVDKIRKTAADLFEIPHTPMDVSHVFEFKNQPYWVTHKWDSTFSPIPENWFDYFLPRNIRRKRAFARLSEKLDRLVMHNVENLRWATLQNLNRAFMRFSLRIDECMEETLASTKGAIETAARKRAEHADVIADEVAFLEMKIKPSSTYGRI